MFFLLYIIHLQLECDITDITIGVLDEGFVHCDDGVTDLNREAYSLLETRGATIKHVSIPEHKTGNI